MAKAKAKAMTQVQIVAEMADRMGMDKKDVKQFFMQYNQLAYSEAKKGFPVIGFGKLILKDRKKRMARNPQTGEPVKVPAKKNIPKFRLNKVCKDAIQELYGSPVTTKKKSKKKVSKKTAKKKGKKKKK